jgi:4,5-DOPA dioxygenase extradiol
MLPSLFISHGSPALVLQKNDTTEFLQNLSSLVDIPKYILVISAHWTTNELQILANDEPFLIYDFYNFPNELYAVEYPIQNSMDKVNEIFDLLKQNNIVVSKNEDRSGYDHGVWSPLKLIYPNADIPVIQLSLPMNYTPNELIKLGEVLYSLRVDTLIIGSGSMTHDLARVNYTEINAKPEIYAKKFRDWIVEKLEKGDSQSVAEFLTQAPYGRQNHPTVEHFLPLFIAMGASKESIGKSLHDRYMFGNLSLDTIIFRS